ncbi:MAG TPA: hypothetical protein VMW53_06660 [archaeon]|nr:hypothetical protein [archaeon]
MKDSKGRKISIGDRVKILWNRDNKIHMGVIEEIRGETANVALTDVLARSTAIATNRSLTKIR